MTRPVLTALVFAAVTTAVSALVGCKARAHEAPTGWSYPAICCSAVDCKQIDPIEVRAVQTGWLVEQTGEVIAYGSTKLKDSPDGLYHRCARNADFVNGETLCLFVPPMGF